MLWIKMRLNKALYVAFVDFTFYLSIFSISHKYTIFFQSYKPVYSGQTPTAFSFVSSPLFNKIKFQFLNYVKERLLLQISIPNSR